MLRTVDDQATLWEAVLPEAVLGLPADLEAVDSLLDDAVFVEAFRPHFHATLGRPSTPVATYLRLMFLKHRYGLGYERLCAEVQDSITWQRFCRISIGGRVPDPTTLMKLTKRCGADAVDALNEALVVKAAEDRLVRTHRVRADTTVVEANVSYPTDSGLCAKAVTKIVRIIKRVKAAGGATRTRFRDRRRAAGRRVREISAHLRRRSNEARDDVLETTGRLADLATATIRDATRVLENARRGRRRGAGDSRLGRALDELDDAIDSTERIIDQTERRLRGDMPTSSERVVSLHDADARPIRKGRIDRPVEFGYKVQICDNVDGIVLDYSIHQGNPPDSPLLAPAVERITARTNKAPRAVTADRGYGTTKAETELADLGVKRVVLPRKGRVSKKRRQIEHERPFRTLVKWRTGSEARISHLKHKWQMARTSIDGLDGTHTHCGWAILSHNLQQIGRLNT